MRARIDDVYGPIYSEINNILGHFSEKEVTHLRSNYHGDINKSWESIKSSYLYYLIDLDLREELDKFFNLVTKHDANYNKSLNVAEKIFHSHLRHTFGGARVYTK